MANSILIKVTCLVVTCLVLGIPLANASLSCDEMIQTTALCIEYLMNPGPSVPEPCCNGIRTINEAAKTTDERRNGCKCFKPVVIAIAGINDDALASLPGKCGVPFPMITVGRTLDCNTIP
ncbi:hypothetical protein P8452_65086 [Trifolium repens]|nr:hypothetical protein P8452_65086 [Trifolium repens]